MGFGDDLKLKLDFNPADLFSRSHLPALPPLKLFPTGPLAQSSGPGFGGGPGGGGSSSGRSGFKFPWWLIGPVASLGLRYFPWQIDHSLATPASHIPGERKATAAARKDFVIVSSLLSGLYQASDGELPPGTANLLDWGVLTAGGVVSGIAGATGSPALSFQAASAAGDAGVSLIERSVDGGAWFEVAQAVAGFALGATLASTCLSPNVVSESEIAVRNNPSPEGNVYDGRYTGSMVCNYGATFGFEQGTGGLSKLLMRGYRLVTR